MTSNLTLTNIINFGERLRGFLWEQYNKVPEEPIKFGGPSRNTHIRVLVGMLPDWAVEIAQLSFKDPQREVYWDPEYLLSLEFSKPIL